MSEPDHEYDFKGFDVRYVMGASDASSSHTTRTLLVGLCLASLVLIVFLSHMLVQEVRGLPPGNIEDRIVSYSQSWHERVTEFGLGQPLVMTRETIENWQSLSWEEVQCLISDLAQTGPDYADGYLPDWLGITCSE